MREETSARSRMRRSYVSVRARPLLAHSATDLTRIKKLSSRPIEIKTKCLDEAKEARDSEREAPSVIARF